MITLGMETSCDETSVAIIEDGVIRSNIISSQIPVHRAYGGVVPEIASRKHLENVSSVLDESMREANVSYGDLNLIAVTRGPYRRTLGRRCRGQSHGTRTRHPRDRR